MKRNKMRRGNKRHYRALGKLGAGISKTFSDAAQAKEQRRLAGIASGRARAMNAKSKAPKLRLGKPCPSPADLSEIASQIHRLNESAKALS